MEPMDIDAHDGNKMNDAAAESMDTPGSEGKPGTDDDDESPGEFRLSFKTLSYGICFIGPLNLRSRRLNKRDKEGKIKSVSGQDHQPTSKHRPKPKIRPPPAGNTSQKSKPVKFVPFQEVKKGVFVQQVRVKTFEVSYSKTYQ
jgi:hypothetical protein